MDIMGIIGPLALCLGAIVAAAVVYSIVAAIKTKLQEKKQR